MMARTPLDLSPEAQATFGQVVFRMMDKHPELSYEEVYAGVLEGWKLDCPLVKMHALQLVSGRR
jgi:hypothetical protein